MSEILKKLREEVRQRERDVEYARRHENAISTSEIEDAERKLAKARREEENVRKELTSLERRASAAQKAIARFISPIEVKLYQAETRAGFLGKNELVRDLHKARDLIKGIKEKLEAGHY